MRELRELSAPLSKTLAIQLKIDHEGAAFHYASR